MGSFIELNDTLQITKAQGFHPELDLDKHLEHPFTAEAFKDRIFAFHDKQDVRIYKLPPVRNFFVENRDGKWIYWGLIFWKQPVIMSKRRSPEKMKKAHELIDRRAETQYFK